MKSLEKDRTRRYGSASDLAADIRRFLHSEPVLAGPPGALYRVRKFVRRHPSGLTATAVVLIVLIAFGLTMAMQARRLAAERDATARERDRAEQVSAFLVSLFQASDPDRSKGNTLTARDLLDRGVTAARLRAQGSGADARDAAPRDRECLSRPRAGVRPRGQCSRRRSAHGGT